MKQMRRFRSDQKSQEDKRGPGEHSVWEAKVREGQKGGDALFLSTSKPLKARCYSCIF